MDDQKEKKNAMPDAAPENEAAKAEEQAIHDEMEDLAKVFQEELDRAKAEAAEVANTVPEEPEILIQGLDDLPDPAEEIQAQEDEETEKEPCACCGEHPAGTHNDPNSPYCETCDTGLRHYPFDFVNILLVLAVLCFVFYGGYVFADHTQVFSEVHKADTLARQNKLYSALDAYSTAANTMVNQHINGEMVYKREILLAYRLGGINIMQDPAENIKSWEMSLPHFRSLRLALDDAEAFLATTDAANAILAPYDTTKAEDIPYDDLIAQLDALKDQTITTTEAASDTDTESETTTAASGYTPKAEKYSAAMLAFFKYQTALICEKDMETQLAFAEEIREYGPQYPWLYGAILGDLYARSGKDVEPICQLLEAENAEDDTPALLRAIVKRMNGDYDGAIAICEEKLEAQSSISSEFYRQEGLCYLAKGDYETAYSRVNEGFQNTTYPSMQYCNTLALCAAAAGQTDAYDEIDELFQSSGYTISAEVSGYKNGTVTLESILLEGDFDV